MDPNLQNNDHYGLVPVAAGIDEHHALYEKCEDHGTKPDQGIIHWSR